MKRSAAKASPSRPDQDLTAPPIPREALLPLPEVVRLTNLCQAEIYNRMKLGTFPLARQLGVRRIAWLAAEVFDWQAALPKWKPAGAE